MSEEMNNGRLLDRNYHFHSKIFMVKIAEHGSGWRWCLLCRPVWWCQLRLQCQPFLRSRRSRIGTVMFIMSTRQVSSITTTASTIPTVSPDTSSVHYYNAWYVTSSGVVDYDPYDGVTYSYGRLLGRLFQNSIIL